MHEKLYLYPKWVRLWHLVNALLCLLLILTGLSMQYSGVESNIMRFDIAVSIHNVAGIILSINYVFFIIGNLTTSNGKQYIMKRKNIFNNMYRQFIYYSIGIFKKAEKPFPISKENKFNPLQRFSYIIVIYVCLT
ncbi:cytochrome b/b6 domain-containing protein, partial [Bacteroidota bacterium]